MSAKANNQPGRRTPLSLSCGLTKVGQIQNNRGGSSTNNSNGHTNNLKVDNKNKTEQQQTNAQKHQPAADPKENPTKLQKQTASNADSKNQKQQISDQAKSHKQTNQNEKKQLAAEKQQQQQNGVSNNHKTAASQQQQINKEKQQSADTEAKPTEKDNKKPETTQDKHKIEEKDKNKNDDIEKNKVQEKSDKEEKKQKIDKKKQESEKDEDVKKVSNIEIETKQEESSEFNKKAVKNAGADNIAKDNANNKKDDDDAGKIDVVEDNIAASQQQQQQQNPSMSAPATPKSVKDSKQSTPNKPTPTKTEKTPQKSTPTKREVTTCIDDFEMEPLNVESSPSKPERNEANAASSAPCATSTPGKILLQKPSAKTYVQLVTQPSTSPERPRAFSQISGRRAIRPVSDYTPSKFQSNLQFRESYRRINTELDVTNTSLNVTVGSEIPNNASFSFFGRGRKRDRTPPQHSQSAIGELQSTEMEMSPPKKARIDFFSVVSSPLTLLRNRFSKATLQSSTPVKLQQKVEENEDEIEVQNVSGVSVHEEIGKSDPKGAIEGGEYTSLGVEVSFSDNTPIEGELEILDNGDKELAMKSEDKHMYDYGDIKITETPLQVVSGDSTAKNKRCVVM